MGHNYSLDGNRLSQHDTAIHTRRVRGAKTNGRGIARPTKKHLKKPNKGFLTIRAKRNR